MTVLDLLIRPTQSPLEIAPMLNEQHHEELRALRNLEKTVRAFGVTASVMPVHRRMEMLSLALKDVIDARKRAIRTSRLCKIR